jgi:hypothetical protein
MPKPGMRPRLNWPGSEGTDNLDAKQVANLPMEKLLERLDAVPDRHGEPDSQESKALWGGGADPQITLTRALDLYWSLARGKSTDQVRRWRNSRIKEIGNLAAVIGDKALGEITRDDVLEFRDWWADLMPEMT